MRTDTDTNNLHKLIQTSAFTSSSKYKQVCFFSYQFIHLLIITHCLPHAWLLAWLLRPILEPSSLCPLTTCPCLLPTPLTSTSSSKPPPPPRGPKDELPVKPPSIVQSKPHGKASDWPPAQSANAQPNWQTCKTKAELVDDHSGEARYVWTYTISTSWFNTVDLQFPYIPCPSKKAATPAACENVNSSN